jgi:hypothetical protein
VAAVQFRLTWLALEAVALRLVGAVGAVVSATPALWHWVVPESVRL